eukprot:gene5613-10823_t
MRLQKLHKVILPEEEGGVSDEELNGEKNAEAFAELVQCLDDRSLSLVLRDAKDKELTSLKKTDEESVTDYIIRAETAATSLKSAGETISDSLLIAMVLKGLPAKFKPFSTVVTQKDKDQTFTEFKVALRSFEETEKAYCEEPRDSVMKFSKRFGSGTRRKPIVCYTCGKPNHKSTDPECPEYGKKKKWCHYCKTNTHNTDVCRKKKDSVKSVAESAAKESPEQHSFIFKIGCSQDEIFCEAHDIKTVLVDCGATTHVVKDKSYFINMDSNFDSEKHFIELADGSRIRNTAQGRGDARICLIDSDGNEQEAILKDALFVPTFKQNILSVQAATEKGAEINFKKNSAELISPNGTKFNIKKSGRLYYLCSTVLTKSTSHTLKEWHEIMGHCNSRDIIKLEGVVDGMKITSKDSFQCDICIEGKMTQYRNRSPDKRANAPLELVHVDLAGPIEPADRNGFRYVMSIVDDYSSLIMVYFLKGKNDAIHAMEKFLADVAVYGTVKRMRCDNGGEFTSEKFKQLLIENKIKQEMSAPYSPHQNGTVERSWRSIFDMARCLLLESTLPKSLWVYAVMKAVYVRNRCYNPRTEKTAVEAFTGHKPNIGNMNTFGSVCFAYTQNKTKLDARSEKGIFIGYDKNSPAYLIYFPNSGNIRKVRCVKFSTSSYEQAIDTEDIVIRRERQPDQDEKVELQETVEQSAQLDPTGEDSQRKGHERRYPTRERKQPKYFKDYVTESDDIGYTVDFCYAMCMDEMPTTYDEALVSSEASHWKTAMQEEMCALKDNQTFDLVKLPEEKTLVGGRWLINDKFTQSLADPCVYTKNTGGTMIIIIVWVDDIIIASSNMSSLNEIHTLNWLDHCLDIWHTAKNISKKLHKTAQDKAAKSPKPLIAVIVNHFLFACQVSNGDAEKLKDIWIGVLHHVCNEHIWKESECLHGPLSSAEPKVYLLKNSVALE